MAFIRAVPPNLLQEKFRGCMVGALVGDCLGEHFGYYFEHTPAKTAVSFDGLLEDGEKGEIYQYTDDTAMRISLAQSLIHCNGYDAIDCATRYKDEFFESPSRGYGPHVQYVFKSWKHNPDEELTEAARRQFDGAGSYGNGAAMRVCPVALFCYDNLEKAIQMAIDSSLITHSNKLGYNGAVLECLAVLQALHAHPGQYLDPLEFVENLKEQIKPLEDPADPVYYKKLEEIQALLSEEAVPGNKLVVEKLGHGVLAPDSIPAAIYSFLLAESKTIPGVNSESLVQNTVIYATSLGGDSDTIATMAGAIAGAYTGINDVPEVSKRVCEGTDLAITLADELFKKLILEPVESADDEPVESTDEEPIEPKDKDC